MRTTLQAIATKARRDKKYKFRNLYGLLNEENLLYSWQFVNKKAAKGVDKISALEYQKNLVSNVKDLVARLKRKGYRTKFVKRVYIPKGNGKVRALGLPSIEDKLVQTNVALILNAIFETDFLSCSYGYRPDIGARNAVEDMTKELYGNRHNYIVEADIKGFFDNIEHDWLLRMLRERIDDRAFIGLIEKWLKAGILETTGKVVHPTTGTPQGGIVSPILANIYLHYVLDLWYDNAKDKYFDGKSYYIRYADDFICSFRFIRDARKFYDSLLLRLKKFGLEVALEKTKIISFSRYKPFGRDSFEFLGFEYRWVENHLGKPIIRTRTSRKKLKASIQNFTKWCRESRNYRLQKYFNILNAKLRGYYNYYGIQGNYISLKQFYRQVELISFKWLNRRSQRRSFTISEFYETLKRYKIERPRITVKTNSQLLFDWH